MQEPSPQNGAASTVSARQRTTQLEGEVRRHDGVGCSAAQGVGAGEQQAQEAVGRVDVGQGDASGSARPKVVSRQAKREAVRTLMTERGMGVTRACGLVGISRLRFAYESTRTGDAALTERMKEMAVATPSGNRAESKSWSMGFVADGLAYGRRCRCLNIVDDYTRPSRSIHRCRDCVLPWCSNGRLKCVACRDLLPWTTGRSSPEEPWMPGGLPSWRKAVVYSAG